jgi:hypothetical protein
MGDVIQLARNEVKSHWREQDYDLVRAIDEALGSVAKTLRIIQAGVHSRRTYLQALSADLLVVLTCVGRDPATEASIDHLYEAARRLTGSYRRDGSSHGEMHDNLKSAYLRLRREVGAALMRRACS